MHGKQIIGKYMKNVYKCVNNMKHVSKDVENTWKT